MPDSAGDGAPSGATAPVRTFSVAAKGLSTISSLPGQVTPGPVVDAATLARHDRNQNGRLDPDEQTALEAAQNRNVPVIAAVAGEEAVVLSPFEVVADTKGYFAANTMAGTRLNTKLEDLASAITVITKEQMADFGRGSV